MRVVRLARVRSESSRESPLWGILAEPPGIINISGKAAGLGWTAQKREKCPEMIHFFERKTSGRGLFLDIPQGQA